MDVGSTAVRGFQTAELSMAARARNVANANTPNYRSIDVVVSDGSPRLRYSSSSAGGFSDFLNKPVGPLVPQEAQASSSQASRNGSVPTSTASSPDDSWKWGLDNGAQAKSTASKSGWGNDVDLARDLVGMRMDSRMGTYGMKALKVQDRMTGSLLDILA